MACLFVAILFVALATPDLVSAQIGFDGQHYRRPHSGHHHHTQRNATHSRPHSHHVLHQHHRTTSTKHVRSFRRSAPTGIVDKAKGAVQGAADAAKGAAEEVKIKVMNSIDMMRAETCAKMYAKHEDDFSDNFLKCKEFMLEACHPGSDKVMDGEDGEFTTRHGYCRMFFPEDEEDSELAQHMVENDLDDSDVVEQGLDHEFGTAEDDGSAGDGGESEANDEKAGGNQGDGADGDDGGDGSGITESPRKEFSKADWKALMEGKMSATDAIASQGFGGPPIAHSDMETHSDDWLKEYGKFRTEKDSRYFREICKRYPDNEWCLLHGFSSGSSGAAPRSCSGVPFVIVSTLAAIFGAAYTL